MDAFFGVLQEMIKTIRVSSETAKRASRAIALTLVMAASIIAVLICAALVARYLWP
jgi:hypothetical protein